MRLHGLRRGRGRVARPSARHGRLSRPDAQHAAARGRFLRAGVHGAASARREGLDQRRRPGGQHAAPPRDARGAHGGRRGAAPERRRRERSRLGALDAAALHGARLVG
eukprot:541453-Prymnesium_polylepis.1